MKVLALYTTKTLAIIRRVMAPYSCLAERGHSFSFQAVTELQAGLAYGRDITVLPNWVLTSEENDALERASQDCSFVYDLSDQGLLDSPQVRRTLTLCRTITVPNEYLATEVRGVVSGASSSRSVHVTITPSVVDIPYFVTARRLPYLVPGATVIGCYGNHDWDVVRPVIATLRAKHKRVEFLGDDYAYSVLGDLVTHVRCDVDTYPQLVNSCSFGLCPYTGYDGRETVWAHEYGILYKPVIASSDSQYSKVLNEKTSQLVTSRLPERWVEAVEKWLTRPELRARAAKEAFDLANLQRPRMQVEPYLKVMSRLLPHSALIA